MGFLRNDSLFIHQCCYNKFSILNDMFFAFLWFGGETLGGRYNALCQLTNTKGELNLLLNT